MRRWRPGRRWQGAVIAAIERDGDGVLESEIGASWVSDGAKAKVDAKDGKVTTEATVKHHSDDGISVRLGQEFAGGGLSEHFDGQDASANYSFAHGHKTKASGQWSHAEGRLTTGSGDNSHAEGYKTHAIGSYWSNSV